MGRNRIGPRSGGRPASPGYRNGVVEVLDRLLTARPEVTRGKMFGFPAFYTRGKLFACVYGDGVGLKLPQTAIRTLEGKPGITPFQPYGKARMKEWIHIRHDQPGAFSEDAALFQASIRFVCRTANQPKRTPGSHKT